METRYFNTREAAQLLNNRQPLRQLVEGWWFKQGWGLPPLPQQTNLGIMAPHIATCRYEDVAFVRACEQAGLHPSWAEYLGDRFSSASQYKMSLIRPRFLVRRGRNGGEVLEMDKTFHQMGIQNLEGLLLSNIVTESGQRLVEFHHTLQHNLLGPTTRFDLTPWYRQIGPVKQYYRGLLSLFVAHGVLFEDYDGGEDGEGTEFREKVFLPACEELHNLFGVAPLLTRLPWRPEMAYFPRSKEVMHDQTILGEKASVA